MVRTRRMLKWAALAGSIALLQPAGWAQRVQDAEPATTAIAAEPPDAQRTRDELSRLLDHYPPALREVLALDPSLAANQSYLAPYPDLVRFLRMHGEVARDPAYYFGEGLFHNASQDPASRIIGVWEEVMAGMAALTAFGMAIGLVIWLIRTVVNYKRWSRLAKVQTDAHTKILDRCTANEDLIAYIQSPAGSKFLQSSPITLDEVPRVGAPLGRVLWSVQGGVVLLAGGIGLLWVSGHISTVASQPLNVFGVLAIALGLGFLISAIISYVISHRLGLIEAAVRPPHADQGA